MDRNQIRQRRKKKRARKVLLTRIILGVLVIGIPLFFVVRHNYVEKKKAEQEAERQRIEELEKTERAKASINSLFQDSIADWIFDQYDEKKLELLNQAAGDSALTEREIYEVLGESIYVVKDRYRGYLDDERTAQSHNIYFRDDKLSDRVTIAIAGDLCLAEDGFVLDHYDTVNDLSKCISPDVLNVLKHSDLFYVNHEYCISDKGMPLEGKYYTFRAKPERMELLKQMGTDLVSLANNHVFDYGAEALYDTADLLDEAGIPYVGGGRNIEEAKRPIYYIVDGIKIGFVAASNGERIKYTPQATETSPGILRAYDTTEYNEVIRAAAKECDYLIAYIHWGTEDSNYLNADQQAWGREFLSSGADIVVGGHPHVLQGIEYVDEKPIIYSLGDFWFNHETKYTGVLKLQISQSGLEEMSFVPCLQTGYTTQYISEKEKQQELYQFLEDLSIGVEIDENGVFTKS